MSLLTQARNQFPHINVAAIGGITLDNAPELIGSGANLIAVCHSLFSAPDIKTQTSDFIDQLC
jgi:thiamine-phosphate pyrophosphorylase